MEGSRPQYFIFSKNFEKEPGKELNPLYLLFQRTWVNKVLYTKRFFRSIADTKLQEEKKGNGYW